MAAYLPTLLLAGLLLVLLWIANKWPPSDPPAEGQLCFDFDYEHTPRPYQGGLFA